MSWSHGDKNMKRSSRVNLCVFSHVTLTHRPHAGTQAAAVYDWDFIKANCWAETNRINTGILF